jgi:hypothetical protein
MAVDAVEPARVGRLQGLVLIVIRFRMGCSSIFVIVLLCMSLAGLPVVGWRRNRVAFTVGKVGLRDRRRDVVGRRDLGHNSNGV